MASVVLVHGAWHGAWCWDGVVEQLDRLDVGHTAIELPFTGFAADAAAARAALVDAPAGSVVIGHSYGGSVISEAAAGVPGVNRLVYLAALMTDTGVDMLDVLGGNGATLLEAVGLTEAGATIDPARARELFYGDSDDETAAAAVARLRPLGYDGSKPEAEPAWKQIPSTYVVCTGDQAIPPAAQRAMADQADDVVEWPTDHSPWLTRPDKIAQLLASYL
jgi:pimeloyl-ACP methyl ester carboxylesterase